GVGASFASGLHRHGEQDRFADRGGPWLEPLLQRLLPEGRKIGRQHYARDDLAVRVLEGGDLGREVVGQILIASGIDKFVALLLEHWREAYLFIPPGAAVAVVCGQRAPRPVGLYLAPHVGANGDPV